MATVEVRLPAMLQKMAGGEKVVSAEAGNVRELVQTLDARFPGVGARLITEDGSLHRFINIYKNDEDIRFLNRLDTPLSDGDVISILPALAGG